MPNTSSYKIRTKTREHLWQKVLVSFCRRIWKEMTLDPKINEFERSKLATWDYPVDDTYTKECGISLKYF